MLPMIRQIARAVRRATTRAPTQDGQTPNTHRPAGAPPWSGGGPGPLGCRHVFSRYRRAGPVPDFGVCCADIVWSHRLLVLFGRAASQPPSPRTVHPSATPQLRPCPATATDADRKSLTPRSHRDECRRDRTHLPPPTADLPPPPPTPTLLLARLRRPCGLVSRFVDSTYGAGCLVPVDVEGGSATSRPDRGPKSPKIHRCRDNRQQQFAPPSKKTKSWPKPAP